jgi:D-glycero-alpha-D-manno-heptose-7-phosphate kinase
MNLIVARAPFRVSFAGGGTDLPAFYKKEDGVVVSASIDKYVYVVINRRNHLFSEGFRFSQSSMGGIKGNDTEAPFRYPVRVSYSKTEEVTSIEQLQHPIVREALRYLKINAPMDISTMADVPAGTGLGSSSTFTVALLQALHAFQGSKVSPAQVAQEASHLEIDVLGRPVGKQDHYAAAFGGINFFQFRTDDKVDVKPVPALKKLSADFSSWLMLLYTGMSRDASTVLSEQKAKTAEKFAELKAMKDHAVKFHELLLSGSDPAALGNILHETWLKKRGLVSGISNAKIDEYYERARKSGALGGKICGAGGGGFLLLVVKPELREKVKQAVGELAEMEFGFETGGSQVILQ